MTVYVDPMMACATNSKWRHSESCHLYTDGDLSELHAFAKKLGLRRSWFQGSSSVPHYDLTRNKRRQALGLGAIADSDRDVLKKLIRSRRS